MKRRLTIIIPTALTLLIFGTSAAQAANGIR
jgi:hypothetical protein